MERNQIHRSIPGRNGLTLRQDQILRSLIMQKRLFFCLELAVGNAISTPVIEGAHKDLGGGTLTSVHLEDGIAVKSEEEVNFPRSDSSPFIIHHHERYSADAFFRRHASDEHHEQFDFCFLDCNGSPQRLLPLIPVLWRLLKSESWIAIYEQPVLVRNFGRNRRMHSNSKGNNCVVSPNSLFSLLQERNTPFCNLRRVERLYLAQKGVKSDRQHRAIVDVAVALAIERAYRDPDFRSALLVRPSTTLAALMGLEDTVFQGIAFLDSSSGLFRFDCTLETESRVYHLEKPKWSTLKPESYYLNLLAARNSQTSES